LSRHLKSTKPVARKSPPRRAPHAKPATSGAVSAGRPFDPMAAPEPDPPSDQTKAAPAPGVPMPEKRYEDLKERARTTALAKQIVGQRDIPRKRR